MFKGVAYSLLASLLFGYLYYFSTLLLPLKGEDIFGYRILFTAPFVIGAVFLFRQKQALLHQFRRIANNPWLILVFIIDGHILGVQMWLFLWAPNNGSALSVSVGYLLLPLLMVVVGWLAFKEHISKLKLAAILIATLGVAINIGLKGGLSWQSWLVCVGYSVYFLIRKSFKTTDLASFCLEICSLLPIASYLAWQVDISVVQQQNSIIMLLLILLGLISGVALILYIVASNLIPINLLGLLGYIEPILMLTVSLLIGETLDEQSYPLFACLFLSMLLIIIDGFNAKKHMRN